jgi:triosephosphate isomerase
MTQRNRKFLIAGNWKMHGTRASVTELLAGIKRDFVQHDTTEMAVFPPFVFLEQAERILTDTGIHWGAQNLATETQGAYTGEISATMLREFGCRYVLVGHSERRALYGESDALVAKKFLLAKQAGLCPVLCVGETLEQRKNDRTQEVVTQQLMAAIEQAGVAALQDTVLAYEPVWAIGTGLTATPEQAQEVHALLRQRIAEQDSNIARQLRILYGGSLKATSAPALFSMPDIDGGLIGGASLDAQEFLQIYNSI